MECQKLKRVRTLYIYVLQYLFLLIKYIINFMLWFDFNRWYVTWYFFDCSRPGVR